MAATAVVHDSKWRTYPPHPSSVASKKKKCYFGIHALAFPRLYAKHGGGARQIEGGEQKIKIKKVLFLLRYNETTTTWERENRRLERDSRGVYTHTHIHTRVRRGVCKTSRPRFVGWNGSIVDDGRLCCYVSSRCFTNSQTL